MTETILQIISWTGAFLLVLAYFLVSRKKVESESKIYHLINLLGAIGVGVNVFYQHVWPALAVQIIWGNIALIILDGDKTLRNARVFGII